MLRFAAVIVLAVSVAAPAQEVPSLPARLDAAVLKAGLGQFWGAVLVARNGEVLLAKGYGYATEDLDPITGRSLFDIGSIAKMFTAAAVLRLQEQGKLSTTDPLSRFFPDAGDAAGTITLHHLLTHTSGKSDTRGAIQQLDFDDRDDAVRRFVASKPAAAPGERFEYCNGGYVVLGAVVEKASGKPFERAVRELVLEPAGMASSGFLDGEGLDTARQTLRIAGPNGGRGRRGLLLDKRVEPWGWGLRGAGGLVTCLDDLLAFDAAIREGRLLSGPAAERWVKPELNNYAYGWMRRVTDDGRVRLSHGGSTRGYMCELVRYPDEGVLIAVLGNESGRSICFAGWIADELAAVLWPPPVLETVATLDFSRETLGRFSQAVFEEGVSIDAAADGDGVVLTATHADPARELLRVRMNRASAERLRGQIERTAADAGRAGAKTGGVKFGLYGYLYRARLATGKALTLEEAQWTVMPSYSGIGEDGKTVSDPRMVITLTDETVQGAWPVMIHADDPSAREIARKLAEAMGRGKP